MTRARPQSSMSTHHTVTFRERIIRSHVLGSSLMFPRDFTQERTGPSTSDLGASRSSDPFDDGVGGGVLPSPPDSPNAQPRVSTSAENLAEDDPLAEFYKQAIAEEAKEVGSLWLREMRVLTAMLRGRKLTTKSTTLTMKKRKISQNIGPLNEYALVYPSSCIF
jgi:hypothetical protein